MTTHSRLPARPQVLHGMGELVAYTPYLLGFHPRDSLVVLGCGAGRVGPTSRVDVVQDPEGQRAVAELVLGQMVRARPEWLEVLLIDDTRHGRALARDVVSLLRRECSPVHHLIVVRPAADGRRARWRPDSCRCGQACPTRWQDVPDHDRIPLVADRVLEGCVPAHDRAELVASLRPRPLVSRAVLAADRHALTPDRYARSLLRVLDIGDGATPVERLPVAVLSDVLEGMADVEVRDHLLGWLVPHARVSLHGVREDLTAALGRAGAFPWTEDPVPDPDEVARMQHRLCGLVTCAPDALVSAPATLLGYWCWAHGGGAMTTIALERALEARPDYRLARLLQRVVENGLRPDDVPADGGDATG